ncbi:hypothetical protein DAQ1742_01863 [Dickeya aquatica]|uniref:Uncharacterized protein n=1 Tax=Dickeya aquatica TaxID=1401087 RepID=A0A375A9U0_9GAMM|nr:hypothetical protein DAQ1742_01863 [Dickeya aquatica]
MNYYLSHSHMFSVRYNHFQRMNGAHHLLQKHQLQSIKQNKQ